jgi:hypothetical protein
VLVYPRAICLLDATRGYAGRLIERERERVRGGGKREEERARSWNSQIFTSRLSERCACYSSGSIIIDCNYTSEVAVKIKARATAKAD